MRYADSRRELSHENYGHELLQAIGRTYISKSEYVENSAG